MPRFYLTTAIDYVNSRPHLGTAYEKITADVIARFKRLSGVDTHFVMGNDEHSQNVFRRARDLGQDPLAYCDGMEQEFREVWSALDLSFDDFIRTTQPRHKVAVETIVNRIAAAGDLYQADYEGWYCVGCEAFKQEKDLVDGLCPIHRTKPDWIKERNHFFKLSAYRDRLLAHFAEHPEFLQPEVRRNEILRLLEAGLDDISISRAGQSWGIPLPTDPSSVVYVWFDALINYASAVGLGTDPALFDTWWPADLHVVGKDITRFHCVIWPAMLMSAGLPVPRQVFGHGWVHLRGEKMSKSLGTAIDPLEAAQRFGPDALRLFLTKEIPYGADGDFTLRTIRRAIQHGPGQQPRQPGEPRDRDGGPLSSGPAHADRIAVATAGRRGDDGARVPRRDGQLCPPPGRGLRLPACSMPPTSTWPNGRRGRWRRTRPMPRPWTKCCSPRRRACAWPRSCSVPSCQPRRRQSWRGSATMPRLVSVASPPTAHGATTTRVVVTSGEALWPRAEARPEPSATPIVAIPHQKAGASSVSEDQPPVAPDPAVAPPAGTSAQEPGATPVQLAVPAPAAPAAEDGIITIDDFMKVELRVGKVLAAEAIPKSKKLLKLTVQDGPESERTILAGIAESYAPDAIVGRTIAFVANLAPRPMMGLVSHGMVLAADTDGKAQLIGFETPPAPGTA